jgi:hypothetical protein
MSDLSPQSTPKRTLITLLSPIAIYEYTPSQCWPNSPSIRPLRPASRSEAADWRRSGPARQAAPDCTTAANRSASVRATEGTIWARTTSFVGRCQSSRMCRVISTFPSTSWTVANCTAPRSCGPNPLKSTTIWPPLDAGQLGHSRGMFVHERSFYYAKPETRTLRHSN